jgi:hypothetical protein
MTHRKALEWWETKVKNCEVTPQALWPTVESLMKRDGPTTVHGPLGITYHLNEKVSAIVDSLENQFTSHDQHDKNHMRQVETGVQALFASANDTPLGKVQPCVIHKLVNSLKLRKACGFDSIPNKCLRHLPRRPLEHLTHLFDHCLPLSHFPKLWKETEVITLLRPGKDPKFPQNLCLISLLSTTGILLEKAILKIAQRHTEERCLLNASQFGFCAHHSMTLQCMRPTDITFNFNNNMSTAAVFFDIETAFDTTWHLGLLYKLSELKFLMSNQAY